MTYTDLENLIKAFNIPYVYHHFKEQEKQKPPYICWYFLNDYDFMADNINFQPIRRINIDVYTKNKDLALEKQIENILKANGIAFSYEEEYNHNENEYIVTYTIQPLITE